MNAFPELFRLQNAKKCHVVDKNSDYMNVFEEDISRTEAAVERLLIVHIHRQKKSIENGLVSFFQLYINLSSIQIPIN